MADNPFEPTVKGYSFFFSEIFKGDEEEIGHLIELMRFCNHVISIQRLFSLLDESMGDEEYVPEHDPIITSLINISASQLREILKLYKDFIKLPFYKEAKQSFNEEQKSAAEEIEKYVKEWGSGKGLLHNVLKPLRDLVYHYDAKKAGEWVKEQIENEKCKKPFHSDFVPDEYFFGAGITYDSYLFTRYAFWGNHNFKSKELTISKIPEIQLKFLTVTSAFIELKMKTAKIPRNRPWDWNLKYFYGYEPTNNK